MVKHKIPSPPHNTRKQNRRLFLCNPAGLSNHRINGGRMCNTQLKKQTIQENIIHRILVLSVLLIKCMDWFYSIKTERCYATVSFGAIAVRCLTEKKHLKISGSLNV